jgi:hypothetical protein
MTLPQLLVPYDSALLLAVLRGGRLDRYLDK